MVSDALRPLSRKHASLNAVMESLAPELQEETVQVNLVIIDASVTNMLEVTPILEEEICKAQPDDLALQQHAQRMLEGRPRISQRINKVR